MLAYFLKIAHIYNRGYRNAKNIVVNTKTLEFDNLPDAFNGYTILHLTDLHIDFLKGLEDTICEKMENLNYDLCVLTGDYRKDTRGSFKQILEPMKKLVTSIQAEDGILAVLGNHDTYLMVEHLEQMNIQVLTNESVTIEKGRQQITITGLDDPHYFYTDQALTALEENHSTFKIALVHSAEMYDVAAANNYRLYLCGHTHGGQICLPGGIPIITHLYNGKRFYRGLWHSGDMIGYTSQGTGVVGIPIRFYSQSEITLFTLKRKSQ
jgi:predicted MPP superfamily phosphohydrolase